MFGEKWNRFWERFERAMNALPDAIDEAVDEGIPNGTVMNSVDGHIQIIGRIRSLRINGFLVRVPDHVMKGRRG